MNKLLVTNLPLDFNSSDLDDLFTQVGDVISASVEPNSGVGRVEMVTDSAAQDGIQRFNGETKRGHRLIVREDRPHVAKMPIVRKAAAVKSALANARARKTLKARKS